METNRAQGIHLQSIGFHVAKPASQIQVGDVLVYNYGVTAQVVSVGSASKAFMALVVRAESGKEYASRMKKDRLVAWSPKATATA